jgi:hypothetical protein
LNFRQTAGQKSTVSTWRWCSSGLRIGTHTKFVYENGDKETDKERGASSMNPFKLDLMARIGWGKINLYGKYALSSTLQRK